MTSHAPTRPLIITHDGPFHADEALGFALFSLLEGPADLVRTADPSGALDSALKGPPRPGILILDCGGRLGTTEADGIPVHHLDHHQDPSLPCAAVLMARHLENRGHDLSWTGDFLPGVDARDRGDNRPQPGLMDLNQAIAAFNPVDASDAAAAHEAFLALQAWLRPLLQTLRARRAELQAFKDRVETACSACGALLELSACGPGVAMQAAGHAHIRAIIMPSPRAGGLWNLQTVADPDGRPRLRLDPAICKAHGATFVHPGAFIAAFPSREQAHAAAAAHLAAPPSVGR